MPALILPELPFDVVDSLMVQAIKTHPRTENDDPGRYQAVMMTFADLIRLEHQGWISRRGRRADRREAVEG